MTYSHRHAKSVRHGEIPIISKGASGGVAPAGGANNNHKIEIK